MAARPLNYGKPDATYFGGPASLKPLNESNIGMLRAYLEEQESQYSDTHYSRAATSEGYSLIAICAGRPIGCICCSLEEDAAAAADAAATPFSPLQTIWRQSRGKSAAPPNKVVKVMLLQVTAGDRCRGIGSNMLRYVIRSAKADAKVSRLVLDVHSENEGAIRLYRRFGFRITHSKQNHSKSWVMELPIGDAEVALATTEDPPSKSSSASAGKGSGAADAAAEENVANVWRRRLVEEAAAERRKDARAAALRRLGVGDETAVSTAWAAASSAAAAVSASASAAAAASEGPVRSAEMPGITTKAALAERIASRRRMREEAEAGRRLAEKWEGVRPGKKAEAATEAAAEAPETLPRGKGGRRPAKGDENASGNESRTREARERRRRSRETDDVATKLRGVEADEVGVKLRTKSTKENNRWQGVASPSYRWTVYSVSSWRRS